MDAIESDRLVLRGWQNADFAPFTALNADSRVIKFFPSSLSRWESYAFTQRIQDGLNRDGVSLYAVEIKSSGTFIGYVGFAHANFSAPFIPALNPVGNALKRRAFGMGNIGVIHNVAGSGSIFVGDHKPPWQHANAAL